MDKYEIEFDLQPLPGVQPGSMVLRSGVEARDVWIHADWSPAQVGHCGVVFRYRNDWNYTRLSVEPKSNKIRLERVRDGKRNVLAEATLEQAQLVVAELVALDKGLAVWVGGKHVLGVTDSEVPESGRIGWYAYKAEGAKFEKLEVDSAHAGLMGGDVTSMPVGKQPGPPPPSQASSRPVGRWIVHDNGGPGAHSDWTIRNGTIGQWSNLVGDIADAPNSPFLPGTIAVASESGWTDFDWRVTVQTQGDGALGLWFRATGTQSGYALVLNRAVGASRFLMVEDGKIKFLQKVGINEAAEVFWLPAGHAVRLRVLCVRGRVRVWANGHQLNLQAPEGGPAFGTIGLFTDGCPGTEWSDLAVFAPEVDDLALDVSVLVADGESGFALDGGPFSDVSVRGQVVLAQQTEAGVVARYAGAQGWCRWVLLATGKYTGSLRLERSLPTQGASPEVLWQAPWSGDAFAPRDLALVAQGNVLRGYVDGVDCCRVELPTGQGSDPSESSQVGFWRTTGAQVSGLRAFRPWELPVLPSKLAEGFQDVVLGRWRWLDPKKTPSFDPKVEGWAAKGGVLTWSSWTAESRFVTAAGATLQDGRVSVRLQAPPVGAEAGIVVRASPDGKGVHFVLQATPSGLKWRITGTDLKQSLNGDVATVAPWHWHCLVLDVLGNLVRAYVDGSLVHEVTTSFTDKGVALARKGAGTIKVGSVDVVEAAWATLHRFDATGTIADGTELTVATDPGPSPGAHTYPSTFRATAWSAEEPCVLRAVDMRGKVADLQSWYGGFQPMPGLKWLRRRDGSAVFLTCDGPALAPDMGTWRLGLTWARKGKGLATLTVGGSSDVETGRVDF